MSPTYMRKTAVLVIIIVWTGRCQFERRRQGDLILHHTLAQPLSWRTVDCYSKGKCQVVMLPRGLNIYYVSS